MTTDILPTWKISNVMKFLHGWGIVVYLCTAVPIARRDLHTFSHWQPITNEADYRDMSISTQPSMDNGAAKSITEMIQEAPDY